MLISIFSSICPVALMIVRYQVFTLFGVTYPVEWLRIFMYDFLKLMLFGSRFMILLLSAGK